MTKLATLFSLILTLPLLAHADWSQLTADDLTIQDPPIAGSSVEAAEVNVLIDLQNRRTQQECAMGKAQLSPTFDVFYRNSGLLTQDEYNSVQRPLQMASSLASRIATQFKNRYRRPRPYDAYSQQIHPCIPLPGGAKSYPSMHAAVATVGACIMASVFPAKAQTILTYGDRLGTLREVVGVHYPSDVEAGKSIGNQICKVLLADPGYTKMLPH